MITIKIFIPRKPIEPNLERISIFERNSFGGVLCARNGARSYLQRCPLKRSFFVREYRTIMNYTSFHAFNCSNSNSNLMTIRIH